MSHANHPLRPRRHAEAEDGHLAAERHRIAERHQRTDLQPAHCRPDNPVEGEASILGGLLQQSLSNNFTGTPGLSQIPLLKYLFSNNDKIQSQDEFVFMLIPHVVRGEELAR